MKFLAGLLASLALVLGALTAAPAQATTYPHSITTTCQAWTVGGAHVNYRLSAGTAHPSATVRVRIFNHRNVLVKTVFRSYTGGVARWWLGRGLRTGNYRAVFLAKTAPNSVYKNCSTSTTFHRF